VSCVSQVPALPKQRMQTLPARTTSTARARRDSSAVPGEGKADVAVAHHRVGPDTARNGAGTVERCRRDLATATVIGNSIEVTREVIASARSSTRASSSSGGVGNLHYAPSSGEGDTRILVSLSIGNCAIRRVWI
jgi:hypothetical protein